MRIPPEKEAEHKGTRGLSAKYYRPGSGNDNNKNIELLFHSEPTYGDSLSRACPAPAARNRCGPVPNSWGGVAKGCVPHRSGVTNPPRHGISEPDLHLVQLPQTPEDAFLSLSHRKAQKIKEPK